MLEVEPTGRRVRSTTGSGQNARRHIVSLLIGATACPFDRSRRRRRLGCRACLIEPAIRTEFVLIEFVSCAERRPS